MSASLRNARSQISTLQGRLEGLNLLNMDNVQAMVDRQVENITGVVNKLSSTCTTACPVQNAPQCKPAFTKISLIAFFFVISITLYCLKTSPSSLLLTIYSILTENHLCVFCWVILFQLCYFNRCLSSPFIFCNLSKLDEEALSLFFSPLLFSIALNSPWMLLLYWNCSCSGPGIHCVVVRWIFWHRMYPIMPKWTWWLVITKNNPTLDGHLHPKQPFWEMGNEIFQTDNDIVAKCLLH